jgi:hypothetical protein
VGFAIAALWIGFVVVAWTFVIGSKVKQVVQEHTPAPQEPAVSSAPAVSAKEQNALPLIALGLVVAVALVVLLASDGGSGAASGKAYALPPNPGDRYVKPYSRTDGTPVDGHFRTNADSTVLNNYSGPNGAYYKRLNGR